MENKLEMKVKSPISQELKEKQGIYIDDQVNIGSSHQINATLEILRESHV